MKIFKSIREFFWPLLDKEIEIEQKVDIAYNDIKVDPTNLKVVLEFVIKQYESEEERRKTVESKSSLFIGTISAVTTVIIGVTSFLVKENQFSLSLLSLVFILFVLTIYMSRTVWFSIKTLERKNYHSITENDFLLPDLEAEFYKKVIAKITNKLRKNSVTINSKVDNMVMAQEYFKRAIVVVSIYSFCILTYFISKSGYNYDFYIDLLIKILYKFEISNINLIILYTLILISLLIGIKNNRHLKRK